MHRNSTKGLSVVGPYCEESIKLFCWRQATVGQLGALLKQLSIALFGRVGLRVKARLGKHSPLYFTYIHTFTLSLSQTHIILPIHAHHFNIVTSLVFWSSKLNILQQWATSLGEVRERHSRQFVGQPLDILFKSTAHETSDLHTYITSTYLQLTSRITCTCINLLQTQRYNYNLPT